MTARSGVAVVTVLAAALLAAPASTAAAAVTARAQDCASTEIVIARGSYEETTTGRMKQVADQVDQLTRKTVETYGLPYKASLDLRGASALEGDKMLGTYVNEQARACPKKRFVLLGYSQGAWVVGDALTGGTTPAGSTGPTITPEAGRQIAAIVLFGDPRYTFGEPFNHGTFKPGREGNAPRPAGAYGSYAKRMRSYCDGDDQTCQNVIGLGHLHYWPKYNADAAGFILDRLNSSDLPPKVTDVKDARMDEGLTPALQQADQAIREALKRVQEGIDEATRDDAPPARAPEPKAEKKHWWDTLTSWLNPFD
jgi:acetylxylan esterase